MTIPKINQMKIKVNDIDLFKRVGNLFPTIEDFNIIFNLLPTRTMEILNLLTSDNIKTLTTQYLSKSYNKLTSSLLDLLLLQYGVFKYEDYYKVDLNICQYISRLIDARFYKKWLKLFNSLDMSYDPIRPYDMDITEQEEENTENSVLIKRLNENTSNSESNDKTIIDENQNSIYGFNSNDAVPSDKSVNSSENTSNTSDSFNSSGSTDTDQNRKITNDRNIKRLGNIGNITQQELIKQERELQQYQIFDTIFKDLDSILTCGSY